MLIQPDVKQVLSNVEWNVLLFYASLFTLVGGLEAVGIMDTLAKHFGSFASLHPLLAPIVLVWIAGILSGIIDNVPLTIAVIPIIHGLTFHGVHITSFWWALALGAVLGGMSTPIGSSANVVSVSLSESTDNPITFSRWLKVGVPITLINLAIASSLLFLGMQIGFM